MIDKTLSRLGFNEKETEVYLEVLRRGKTTPAAIAKATGINRATVYSVSKSLLEKGVITEDLAGKSTYLVAPSRDELTQIISAKERDLKQTRRLVHKAIDELAALPSGTQYSVPTIRFVEDENVLDRLYKGFETWLASAQRFDSTWWGFQDHTLVENFHDWIDWTWEQEPENQYARILTNESRVEKDLKEKRPEQRQMRFWKKDADFTATTWILGDYIIMIYTNERPFYLIEIHNPVLAHNMREVFKGIWRDLEKSSS